MTSTHRARSVRAITNDNALRDAAVREITRVGADQLSLREVAHAAGLTHGAAYARFEDADELLVDLWYSVLRDRLQRMYELSLAAAEDPSSKNVGEIFELLRGADARDLAAVEILLTSHRMPVLYEECEGFIHNYLDLDMGTSSVSRAIFSRSVLLFSTVMARLYLNVHFRFDEDYNRAFEELLIESLGISPAEVDSKDPRWPNRRDDIFARFSQGDSLRGDLALATLGSVGEFGYARATISRIARRANSSAGAIYESHHSKEELVVGCFIDILGAQRMTLTDAANILSEGFVASAMRASSDDGARLQRNFVLESFIAAEHHSKIREAIRRQLTELESTVPQALGLGSEESRWFSYMLRTVMAILIGASWLSTLTRTAAQLEFAQFSEPIRQVILSRWLPNWDALSRDIKKSTPAGV